MAGFADLIRDTLKKQGNPTPERRAAIYQSSRQALERMLAKNEALPEQVRVAQREKLELAIAEIEAEFRSAPTQTPAPIVPSPIAPTNPTVAAAPPIPSRQPPAPRSAKPVTPPPAPAAVAPTVVTPRPEATRAPEIKDAGSLSSVSASRARPTKFAGAEEQPLRLEEYPDSYDGTILQERRPYAKMLLWTIILVAIAIAIWWAITFGPALLRSQFDGSVPNPSATIESGSFNPDSPDGWVTIFAPDVNPENIVTGDSAAAELIRKDGRTIARIASNAGNTSNVVRIKIPRGVMVPLQGKAATLELILRAPNSEAQQFTIFCQFAELGNCGRKRFTVGKRQENFIFDVLVNDTVLPEGTDAFIAINTDISLKGAAIDLYSIRVRSDS